MKIFEKGELKLLWPFYIERFISHLLYFVPAFWILQFQQTLSLTQIGILFGILSLSSFIFEIPTGAFADIYGRKASTLLGYFMTCAVVLFFFFARDFYSFVVLFALWGLAGTFISGARESWVVDRLKAYKKGNLVRDFFIKEKSIINLSLFLSGLLGALVVAKLGLNVIWIFACLSYLISGFLLIFIKEYKITQEKKQSFKMIFRQARISIKYSWKHHVLFFLLMATFFIMVRDSFGGDIVWQPLLGSLGFPLFAFGLLFSIMTLIGVFTPFFAKPILKKFSGERNYLVFLMVCIIILDVLVITVSNYVYGLVLLVLIYFSIDLSVPIESSYFQRHTPSKMRATITSFKGMVLSLAYMVGLPVSGFLAEHLGPKYVIALGSVFLIPALILYLKIKEKKR